MTIDDLIRQARTWLARQTQLRAEAVKLGDTGAIAAADTEIAVTESTIATLVALT
jgi:hypothetical protein